MFKKVKVHCTDTDQSVIADVLEESKKSMKVVVSQGGGDITITLAKETPESPVFVGSKFGMEFTSTGEEVE